MIKPKCLLSPEINSHNFFKPFFPEIIPDNAYNASSALDCIDCFTEYRISFYLNNGIPNRITSWVPHEYFWNNPDELWVTNHANRVREKIVSGWRLYRDNSNALQRVVHKWNIPICFDYIDEKIKKECAEQRRLRARHIDEKSPKCTLLRDHKDHNFGFTVAESLPEGFWRVDYAYKCLDCGINYDINFWDNKPASHYWYYHKLKLYEY